MYSVVVHMCNPYISRSNSLFLNPKRYYPEIHGFKNDEDNKKAVN